MVMPASGLKLISWAHRTTQYMCSDRTILHATWTDALWLEFSHGKRRDAASLSWRPKFIPRSLVEQPPMRTLEVGCGVRIGVETRWVDETPGLLRSTGAECLFPARRAARQYRFGSVDRRRNGARTGESWLDSRESQGGCDTQRRQAHSASEGTNIQKIAPSRGRWTLCMSHPSCCPTSVKVDLRCRKPVPNDGTELGNSIQQI
ncbi:hypothetical protein BDW68DRAFT_9140 [Aspergillus falconensis]